MAEAIKDDKEVGNGMSKRQAKKIRMASMNKQEIALGLQNNLSEIIK